MKPFFYLILGTALGLTGCSHMSVQTSETDHSPIRYAEVQHDILFSPSMLKQEYCFPESAMRQIFKWGNFGHEWTLHVQNPDIEYAGFYIREPFELADIVDDTVLYFKFRPASAASQLSVVLIEGDDHARVHRADSLAAYQTDIDHHGWASFKIQLSDFRPLEDRMFTQTGTFNWDDVQQIRFLRNDAQLSFDEIQIRNMRLRPASFAALSAR